MELEFIWSLVGQTGHHRADVQVASYLELVVQVHEQLHLCDLNGADFEECSCQVAYQPGMSQESPCEDTRDCLQCPGEFC